MKRTSDKLTTFLGKKLNQAAVALDKTQSCPAQSRPPRPPSPPPLTTTEEPFQGQPQQGQPLYSTLSDHSSRYDSSVDLGVASNLYQTPVLSHSTGSLTHTTPCTPPVSKVSLSSPYPPNSTREYNTTCSSLSYTTPLNTSTMSSSSFPPPSPYTLPPTLQPNTPTATISETPINIPPPPPISSNLSTIPPFPRHYPPPTNLSNTPLTKSNTPPPLTSLHNTFNNNTTIPPNLLHTIHNRAKQASQKFPDIQLQMSRPIDPSNEADIELWFHQLRTFPKLAITPSSTSTPPTTPTFSLSFTSPQFSATDSTRLKFILRALSQTFQTISLIMPSPAHTRLLPPSIYPIISLSTRDQTLSKESATSFWPFLEEVAGVWGGGVIYGAESRGGTVSGHRQVLSYVHRRELPVLETLTQVLRNVYFGAVDRHHGVCGEVMEIAKWGFRNGVCVGERWREAVVKSCQGEGILPPGGVFLDGSRTVEGLEDGLGVVNKVLCVSTDRGVYYLVNRRDASGGIWLLLGVDCGKVAWSKVMSGAGVLGLDGSDVGGLERAVGGQVGTVRVFGVRECGIGELG